MRFLAAVLLATGLAATGGCAGAPGRGALPAQAMATPRYQPAASTVQYGTYAWSVEDVMSRWHAGNLWTLLAAKHVDGVLAGFDDAYVAKCSTAKGAAEMNAMIAQAGQHGVRVELLLGDPSWILPGGTAGLEKILHELRAVRFAGLDLDLEPNEVTGVSTVTAFKDLVAAMRAYVAASPWPVSLDVNHIYVDGQALRNYPYCLMCGLQRAGVKHVNLMTYVSDPKKVVADVAPILSRYPSVTFTIAQSVEGPSVLPVWDSYWSDGFAVFYRDMGKLDESLKPKANYGGLLIESLHYLERMKP